MDEGLSLVLSVLTFVIILPIIVSSLILYFISRNKKMSIVGSIIGFIGASIIGYGLQVFWYIVDIIGLPALRLSTFVVLILSITLTTFIGLIIIKIFRR